MARLSLSSRASFHGAAFSHISRGSGASLYLSCRLLFALFVFPAFFRSPLPCALLTVPPVLVRSISNLPTAAEDRTPCLRYLACIPAYNYTGLCLCISCVTFTVAGLQRSEIVAASIFGSSYAFRSKYSRWRRYGEIEKSVIGIGLHLPMFVTICLYW